MEMSIFGLGYVGSVSAACFAEKGHTVIGVDLSEDKVKRLNSGRALIMEPDLNNLTATAVAMGNLSATTDPREAIFKSDVSFICVGTPSQKNNQLDLQYVKRVCEDIGYILGKKNTYHTVICRSTMFPGSTRRLVIPTLEAKSGKIAGKDFSVCVYPEFMREGTAVHDFYHPPKNIIGVSDSKAKDLLINLNNSYTSLSTTCLEIEAAELIKYCDNIWHALKVGYANEIGNVCSELGIDSHEVMDVFCKDTKLNLSPYYLKPGFAFGGSCLPKDLRAFLYECQNLNLTLPIMSAVLPSNTLQIEKALNMIIEQGNKRVGILGFSFKADTDDLRESPLVELIERLIGKGYKLSLFDKNVSEAKLHGANKEYIQTHIPHISELMLSSIDEVLTNAETIVIGNKAQEFSTVVDKIKNTQVIIDLVRISDKIPQSKFYKGLCW